MSSGKKLIQASAGQAAGEDFYPFTVDNSLRLDDTSSYLTRTVGSTGNRTKWTYSGWVKFTGNGNTNIIFSSGNRGYYFTYIAAINNALWFVDYNLGSTGYIDQLISTPVFRDYAGWCHIVCAYDSAQGTASNRVKLYVNGERITSFSTANYPTASYASHVNESGYYHRISGLAFNNADEVYASGYQAEPVLIDGQALDPTSFGEDKNGVWCPSDVSGLTFGTNGFYLDFKNGTSATTLGYDVSGNANHFTASGIATTDQMVDTPTNNFCTWNPLELIAALPSTLSDGNLTTTTSGTAAGSTFPVPSSGKWYVEFTVDAVGTETYIGIDSRNATAGTSYNYYKNSGEKRLNLVTTAYGSTYTTGDIIGLAIDVVADTITFYKNNTTQGAITPTTSLADAFYNIAVYIVGTAKVTADFGQGGFTYTPPTDHLALCTANMPEPTLGPNSAENVTDNFLPILYTGNGTAIGSGGKTISDLEFQPDFTWIKNRDAADSHMLFDAVRTATKYIESDTTDVEATDTESLTSFTSTGFTLGNNVAVNTNTEDYVAWNWKANGSGSSNTDGSITSTVSANQDAGFSTVTYTGSSSGISVGHGLSSAPEMLIFKARGTPNGSARNWIVWTKDLTSTNYIVYLSLANAQALVTAGSVLSSSPTATTFSLGTEPSVNWNAQDYVAYCFHSVEGFSKFASYTGNGSTNGPFIYCGFRPAFVIVKRIDSATGGEWKIVDTERMPYNWTCNVLTADASNPENTAEAESTYGTDILSNGIKVRSSHSSFNASGGTYIYMAFAEMPFKYSNAR